MIPGQLLLIKIIGAALLIAGLATAVAFYRHSVYQSGYDTAEALYIAREKSINAQSKAELAKATQEAAARQESLRAALEVNNTQHAKEKRDANATVQKLHADIVSGARRLSVAVTGAGCTVSAIRGYSSAGPGAGSGNQARAELDPATADALVAIAADGDTSIRQANALIDAYQAIAHACGPKP